MTERQKMVLSLMVAGFSDEEVPGVSGYSRADTGRLLKELRELGLVAGDDILGWQVTPAGQATMSAPPAMRGSLVWWSFDTLAISPAQAQERLGVRIRGVRSDVALRRACKAYGLAEYVAGEVVLYQSGQVVDRLRYSAGEWTQPGESEQAAAFRALAQPFLTQLDGRALRERFLFPALEALQAVPLREGLYFVRECHQAGLTALQKQLAGAGGGLVAIPVGQEAQAPIREAIDREAERRVGMLKTRLSALSQRKRVTRVHAVSWSRAVAETRAWLSGYGRETAITSVTQEGEAFFASKIQPKVPRRARRTRASGNPKSSAQPEPAVGTGVGAIADAHERPGQRPARQRQRDPSGLDAPSDLGNQMDLFTRASSGLLPGRTPSPMGGDCTL